MGIIKMKNNVNAAEEAVQPAAAQPARETEGAAVSEVAGALYEMQDKRRKFQNLSDERRHGETDRGEQSAALPRRDYGKNAPRRQ